MNTTKRIFLPVIFFLVFPFLIKSQTPFTELTDSKPHDSREVWSQLKKDFCFVWGNTDTRYPKLSIPNKKGMENKDGSLTLIQLNAWRGERVNAQAVLYSKIDLQNATLSMSDLKSGRNRISSSAIRINPVRYVMTDELNKDGKSGCGHRPDKTKYDSTMVADILDIYKDNFSVPANSVQPVWLTVVVPADAKPGLYSGLLTLKTSAGKQVVLQLKLNVQNQTLPKPSEWGFHLDLWQNPYAVARFHNVPLWSEKHFELMKPLMKMLADAGQKVITATIMHHPWNAQTYDAFDSMIGKIKNLDGSWTYNYEVFDKWVSFMINEVGISGQINCYTLIPWALNFDYYDVASNSIKFVNGKPGAKLYQDYWMPFLTDFARHLKSKGWFEKTTIAMDERSMEDMQQAIKLIKQSDPNFKISLAGNYHPEIEADIYDYCIAFGQEFPEKIKERREKQGLKSTVYTCCTEPFPNTFTFSAPAEAVWIGWHAAAGNYDGYLRWAYNSWTESPLQDSRFRSWAAGDCYLVYPDGRSSIRFERLIEGIQEYEKIQLLKQKWENEPQKLAQLNDIIRTFTIQSKGNQTTEEQVRRAKAVLNSIK